MHGQQIEPREGGLRAVEEVSYEDLSDRDMPGFHLTVDMTQHTDDNMPMTPPLGAMAPPTPRTPLTPIAVTPPLDYHRPPPRFSSRISLPASSLQPSPAPPRILMMPRRSEPQLQHFHHPQTRGRASTSAFHLRRPSIERPRLAPLNSKARPSEKEKMENELIPDEVVDHMFAMTPRSTSSSTHDNEFIPSNSPIAVIEEPHRPTQLETIMDSILATANQLGIAVFIDMMLKLVMFLVFMSYIDPIRMIFSIFGYSSSFSFSVRQYFLFMTFCSFDILLVIFWGWSGFGDKQTYRTILAISNIVVITIEMGCTARLLVLLRRLSPEQFQELQDR